MATQARPFAIVTGASTGIGLELAKLCAARGYDLLIAAEEPAIEEAAATIRATGVGVDVVQADLSTEAGVDQVIARASGRPIGALIANAGRGLGKGFLDQDWKEARYVLDTNVTGTIYLLHELGRQMRAAGKRWSIHREARETCHAEPAGMGAPCCLPGPNAERSSTGSF